MSWQDSAACKGLTDLFYTDKGRDSREAKRVCAGCVVRQPCLNEALETCDQWGVWGGLTPRERLDVRRAERGRLRNAVAPCGTRHGAQRHRNDGELACDECLEAERVYQRARYAARKAG